MKTLSELIEYKNQFTSELVSSLHSKNVTDYTILYNKPRFIMENQILCMTYNHENSPLNMINFKFGEIPDFENINIDPHDKFCFYIPLVEDNDLIKLYDECSKCNLRIVTSSEYDFNYGLCVFIKNIPRFNEYISTNNLVAYGFSDDLKIIKFDTIEDLTIVKFYLTVAGITDNEFVIRKAHD